MRTAIGLAAWLAGIGAAAAKPPEDCAINGIALHGNVQVVDSFADLKVEIVTSFPELRVQPVETFPDDCGEWRFVESFPDFTIQYVSSFPDLKIGLVRSFPGLP